jgi:adenylosuccinate synthase
MSKASFVVDFQYGSTGKGKVAFHEARNLDIRHFVRTGGPNSGHTIHREDGELLSFRQLGAGAVLPGVVNYIAAGCVVDVERLRLECDQARLPSRRLFIDPRAVIKLPSDSEAEAGNVGAMGTTASGNGEAMVRRIRRQGDVLLAGGLQGLEALGQVQSVAPLLHSLFRRGEPVVVEGVQGFELSLFHSTKYPFCTARDTTVAAFASEVGIAPKQIGKIIGVMRSFPIRVGGNSGPMPNEITWEEVARRSGAPAARPELTTVTKRLRRVAEFDFDAIKRACDYNSPDTLAIMGADNIRYEDLGKRTFEELSNPTKEFVYSVEDYTGVRVEYIGTGPHTEEIIRRAL